MLPEFIDAVRVSEIGGTYRTGVGLFDYIIVGAGSAGAVLANRLTANPATRVLVLEAGGSDLRPSIQVPIGYGKAYYDRRINWKYTTEPVVGLGGRTSYWPRGKVLGGSSSINAMVYVRGHPRDFDDWSAAGADGWAWRDVEPYFRKMEDWDGAPDQRRGHGGPLPVRDISDDVHPLCRTWLEAAAQAGLPTTPDYNADQMEGAFFYQLTVRGGRRASTSRCYLRPAMRRAHLRVEKHAQVQRLIFDGSRVVGVEYCHAGAIRTAQARRSVILCAGAVGTPQLLMLSGIGPGQALQPLGIPLKADLPAVGKHMQDHVGVDLHFRSRVATLNQELGSWSGRIRAGLRYGLTRRGPLALSINQGGGFVRAAEGQGDGIPDQQLYFSPVSYTRAPPGKRPMMSPDPFPGFLIGFSSCRPTSRGEVSLHSPNPEATPAIRPNYFDTDHDRRAALEGFRYCRRISATPALGGVIDAEISPGPDVEDDQAVAEFVRDHAWTVFHPCGTCRIGRDPATSVVDARLRVHSVPGLRVVDASVFPNVTSGNINAPTIMVGERAADLIMEDDR